jgi:Holliday junction resolvase RusA-like endonuclease
MIALGSWAGEWPTDKATRYDVRIFLCRETAIRTDLDNAIKLAGDSLNGLVWADDSQIANVRATRAAPSKTDCCMVIDVLPWTGALPSIAELLDR